MHTHRGKRAQARRRSAAMLGRAGRAEGARTAAPGAGTQLGRQLSTAFTRDTHVLQILNFSLIIVTIIQHIGLTALQMP